MGGTVERNCVQRQKFALESAYRLVQFLKMLHIGSRTNLLGLNMQLFLERRVLLVRSEYLLPIARFVEAVYTQAGRPPPVRGIEDEAWCSSRRLGFVFSFGNWNV